MDLTNNLYLSGVSLEDDLLKEVASAGLIDFATDIGIVKDGELQPVQMREPDFADLSERAPPARAIPPIDPPKMQSKVMTPRARVDGKPLLQPKPERSPISMKTDLHRSPGPAQRVSSNMATPAKMMMPQRLDLDNAGMPPQTESTSQKKKKRTGRASTGDKHSKGLRHFSMKVCEKVESKGRTTYNEVAEELVQEFKKDGHLAKDDDGPNEPGTYDEKNIRRRVYDALNVLMAMNIIAKEKKDILWKGLPTSTESDIEQLRAEKMRRRARIDKKQAYLQELRDQHNALQSLIKRNRDAQAVGREPPPDRCIKLPFILIQTKPEATVEVSIADEKNLVHFDFNSAPFEIHDHEVVLRSMGLHQMHS
mmetsp:Transcript_303/g.1012  ORF Transcript_303/g.1012 Transcript_303/m.1012 type:complete len:366 (+) Transcript_303:256-1353(+)